ncbi:hypothetical protein INT43_003157 [Umbelopsis isabellina]|uniref:ARID domain-containing protein n=1 Tax=Mortierella isabellina TaxID=91625 RepID=A0A8H7PQ72_MORIS|nr:hypothetical protein INT43_003157 [Umbelopsis isabellina]
MANAQHLNKQTTLEKALKAYKKEKKSVMSRTVDAIARTPEYFRFMSDLTGFHKQHGTTLQAEPILGGQKLDLLKLFKEVQAAGGYEQVTKDRAWKQLGDNFNFKRTCTNSAYVLKAVYKKNLLGWEMTKVWRLPWDASKEEQHTRDDKKRKPSKMKEPKGHAPKSAAESALEKDTRHLVSMPNMEQLDAFLDQLPTMLEAAGQEPTPHKLDNSVSTRTPKQVPELCNMLSSQIQSKVHSAMLHLLKISFDSPENISDDDVMLIFNTVIPFAESVLSEPVTRMAGDGDIDMTSSLKDRGPVETNLIFDSFRILRNLSYVEANAKVLGSNSTLQKIILCGLNFPTNSKYIELTQHSLDILENISSHVMVADEDQPYYTRSLLYLLYSNDREIILGVLNALACLIIYHLSHQGFLSDNNEAVKRLIQLLLVDDEDLVARTLEFLYVYTSAWPDFTTQLLRMYPGNGISLLTSFLTYKSKKPIDTCDHETCDHPEQDLMCEDPDCGIPNLTHYQDMDEPYRCLGWLKQKFQLAEPDSKLTLGDVYLLYETRFGQERPLDVEKFATVFKIAYPEIIVTGGDVKTVDLDQITFHGIQIKLSILEDAEEFVCKWSNCAQTFPDELHLQHHVFNDHVTPYPAGPYQCHWQECCLIPDGEENTRDSIASHLGTHFFEDQYPEPHSHSHQQGIPLATALLLQNLARQKHNSAYFVPYTGELQNMVDQKPQLAEIIQNILHELQV